MDKYYDKDFAVSVKEGVDELSVNKNSSSDWVSIEMIVNYSEAGRIQLRSKLMAEQLHFMLGRLLDI